MEFSMQWTHLFDLVSSAIVYLSPLSVAVKIWLRKYINTVTPHTKFSPSKVFVKPRCAQCISATDFHFPSPCFLWLRFFFFCTSYAPGTGHMVNKGDKQTFTHCTLRSSGGHVNKMNFRLSLRRKLHSFLGIHSGRNIVVEMPGKNFLRYRRFLPFSLSSIEVGCEQLIFKEKEEAEFITSTLCMMGVQHLILGSPALRRLEHHQERERKCENWSNWGVLSDCQLCQPVD